MLGTGASIPTVKKNHTGILISCGSENVLIDCGEGIQRQFKIGKLNPCRITKILLTHWHGDHVLGLVGLLETLQMSGYSKTLSIYGPRGTKEKITILEKVYGKFQIDLKIQEISSGKIFESKDFELECASMSHNQPCLAYSLIIKDKLRLKKEKIKKLKLPNTPLLSKLKEGKNITLNGKKINAKDVTYLESGKKVSIVLDTEINANALKIAKNSDILICESSFMEEDKDKAKERKHLTLNQAVSLAKKSKSKKLVLTHISDRYENKLDEISIKAKKLFKNSQIAKDFDKFSI